MDMSWSLSPGLNPGRTDGQSCKQIQRWVPTSLARQGVQLGPGVRERLCGQVESLFDLICLTRVTTDQQEKAGKNTKLGGIDFPSGLFKVENKEIAIGLPLSSSA